MDYAATQSTLFVSYGVHFLIHYQRLKKTFYTKEIKNSEREKNSRRDSPLAPPLPPVCNLGFPATPPPPPKKKKRRRRRKMSHLWNENLNGKNRLSSHFSLSPPLLVFTSLPLPVKHFPSWTSLSLLSAVWPQFSSPCFYPSTFSFRSLFWSEPCWDHHGNR